MLGQDFEDDPRRTHHSRQGVPPWFANLLPEGPLRHLIAERADVHERRSFHLLALLGEDLPGAVVLTPDGEHGEVEEDRSPADSYPDGPLRFSLAGVQLKFSAVRDERGLTIPVQGRGGDWIVKLPHERFPAVPQNEHAMMSWAAAAGIDVPEILLADVAAIDGLPDEVGRVDGLAFAIRRFDRPPGGGRVHIEDFAQVLGRAPWEKYRGVANYESLASLIDAICGADDVDEFIRRLVFVVAIGNSDAHLKNWSLIYPDGRNARLSPAYDLVAVSRYEAIESRLNPRLALKIGGEQLAERVTERSFQRFAQSAGLDEGRVVDVVREQAARIAGSWPSVLACEDLRFDDLLRDVLDRRLRELPLFR